MSSFRLTERDTKGTVLYRENYETEQVAQDVAAIIKLMGAKDVTVRKISDGKWIGVEEDGILLQHG